MPWASLVCPTGFTVISVSRERASRLLAPGPAAAGDDADRRSPRPRQPHAAVGRDRSGQAAPITMLATITVSTAEVTATKRQSRATAKATIEPAHAHERA